MTFRPEEVKRDKYGYWLHSALRSTLEDTPIVELADAEGMEFHFVSFDADASEELLKRYFEEDDCRITSWQPTQPEGEGWFLLAIYDTEDGPYACFTRPKVSSAMTQERRTVYTK